MNARYHGYGQCVSCHYTFYRQYPDQNVCHFCSAEATPLAVRKAKCQICGNEFVARDRRSKYCSSPCRVKAHSGLSKRASEWPKFRQCSFCETDFLATQPVHKFCSAQCRYGAKDQRKAIARKRARKVVDN